MGLFDTQGEIQNSDVADALEVSSSTAYNYLEELEGDGAIEQVGQTGRSVVYKRSE
ncbi:MAG: helix-turn-helix domain-containing protein [Candidatus Paceibacterota bacterium]